MKSFELNKEMGQKEHAEAQISQRPYLSRHGQWCQPKKFDGWHLFLRYLLKIFLYSKVLCI